MKKGFNLERIQIFPVAHVFRAGSKIRLNIQAPGGDRTIWNFDTIEKGKTVNTIGLGGGDSVEAGPAGDPGPGRPGHRCPSHRAARRAEPGLRAGEQQART